jgi:membrane protein DedA with SNARE-associated domain
MTDTLFAMVPHYGGWVVLLATFLSCLALPIPSSLMMLAAGAFAASGDLSLAGTAGAAYAGAIAGDQAGYAIGRHGGTPLVARLKRRARIASTVERAAEMLNRRAVSAVFLTRWLFSPLGPYVNFIGGAVGLAWSRFTLGSVTGEAAWVTIYVGLGFAFGSQIALIADIASNLAGLLAAGAVTVLLGVALFRRRANNHRTA